MDHVDQLCVDRVHPQLTSVQPPEFGQHVRQSLQFVRAWLRVERRRYGLKQVVALHQCGLGFGVRNVRLGKLEAGQLELLAVHRVASHSQCKGLAPRVPQLAERKLNANLLAAFGARGHFDRSVGVDDQPMASATVALHSCAVERRDRLGHQNFDRFANGFHGRVAEQPLGGGIPEHDTASRQFGDDHGVQHAIEQLTEVQVARTRRRLGVRLGVQELAVLSQDVHQLGSDDHCCLSVQRVLRRGIPVIPDFSRSRDTGHTYREGVVRKSSRSNERRPNCVEDQLRFGTQVADFFVRLVTPLHREF